MLKFEPALYFFGDYVDRFMSQELMLMYQRENLQCHIADNHLQKKEFESSFSKIVSYLREEH